jgi:hypothetical protein
MIKLTYSDNTKMLINPDHIINIGDDGEYRWLNLSEGNEADEILESITEIERLLKETNE